MPPSSAGSAPLHPSDAAQSKLIPNLDGIRACACLLVVMTHMPTGFGNASISPTGIFFVLSGFLLGHIYGSKPWTWGSAVQFGIARFSRIAPIYWLVVTLCIALSTILPEDFPMRISGVTQIVRHYLFSGSVSVFWVIGPEVQFYLFFLLIWWALANRLRIQSAMPLLGLLCAGLLLTHNLWPGLALPNKLHFFLAGTLAGLVPRNITHTARSMGALSVMQILAVVVLVSPQFLYASKDDFFASIECAIAYAVAVYVLSFSSPWTTRLSANPLARSISQASFSIYLLHVLVFYFGMRLMGLSHDVFDPRWVLLGLAGVVIPMVVSSFIEMPLQKLVRRWLESSPLKAFLRTKPLVGVKGVHTGP